MTQPPANLLLRIEQLLNAGKLQEARVLLVDFIQGNPNSARAWWLLSMTLVDVDRQVACLKRVLRLDPENKLAQTRLARLNNQVTPPTEISPFTSSFMGESEENVDDISIIPDWAKPSAPPSRSQPLPPAAPEAESTAMAPVPVEPEESAEVSPADIEPEKPPVEPPAQVWQPETLAIQSLPDQQEAAPKSAEAFESEPSPVDLLPADKQGEVDTTQPAPFEPEVSSTIPAGQPEPLTVSEISSDVIGHEALVTAQPSTAKTEGFPAKPAELAGHEIVSPEPAPAVPPEAEFSAQPVAGEGGQSIPLPPEPVEPEAVSGIPTFPSTSEPALTAPDSNIGKEKAEVEAPSPGKPEAISTEPPPKGGPEESAEEKSIAIEQGGTSSKPALVAETDELFTTLPIPVLLETVSPEPPEVHPLDVPSTSPASASGTVESSPTPPAYAEPNTASTKRALFSELDKSFNKPPVDIEPAASPSLPPLAVEARVPSIHPVSSRAVASPPKPPTPIKPPAAASRPGSPSSAWEIVIILIVGVVILTAVAVIGYIAIQHRGQAPDSAITMANPQQLTLAVAQTLTNLPLPTLIPTWTLSPTWTGVPTATFTSSPTPSPTQAPTATKTPRPPGQIGPAVGLYAPDFNLADAVSGKQVALSQFEGLPVLIFFWATWCIHCSDEVGSVETISQVNKPAGLVTLTVNAAEDPATVTLFRTDHHLTVPILLDPDSVFKNAYNINLDTIPLHFFVDSSGRIKSIRMGELTQAEMQNQVDAILPGGSTPTP